MNTWFFPSRGYGEIEGFSNPGLEFFKGDPIRAMAREVCQNSLDAKQDNDKPMRIEFGRYYINTADFPGILEMRETLLKCRAFWIQKGDQKTKEFVEDAIRTVSEDNLFVFRISDYNTAGLKGAFSRDDLTPWKSLVQGNAFSIKNNNSAGGSFGIGKAAPFVVSKLQTVFYRTFDEDDVKATQGVTHLVSFEGDPKNPGEDPIRRSTGYFGDANHNHPLKKITKLDNIIERTEYGTDLFIPGFYYATTKFDEWQNEIIIELLENFLYSIYSGKMEAYVGGRHINRRTVDAYIQQLMPKSKHACSFYQVIRDDNEKVIEEIKPFYNLGTLRLRLLYKSELNNKILVVRNLGMKISDISGLPRGISYTGFLELQGEELNKFFRGMENPQHNSWEPKRHSDPVTAKRLKEEVENWVKECIVEKLKDMSGEEMDIDLSAYFYGSDAEKQESDSITAENILDSVKTINIIQDEPENRDREFNVTDLTRGYKNNNGSTIRSGTVGEGDTRVGHRHRTGRKSSGNPTGRKAVEDDLGIDRVYSGTNDVPVAARIIKSNGVNKLIFVAQDDIGEGKLEIVTVGENGKPLLLNVQSVKGISVRSEIKDGRIVFYNVLKSKKNIIEFKLYGDRVYAMGVRAYGN